MVIGLSLVKVIAGSLDSCLHLIGYSFLQIKQINRQLAIKYKPNQKTEFDLSYFKNDISDELKNGRPTRAHVVEWDNRLYGVIVDKGRETVCGQICTVIPKTVDSSDRPLEKRGIKVTSNGIKELDNREEVRQLFKCGKNFVFVSEKGSVFVVPDYTNDGHNYEKELTLILGNIFISSKL